MATSFSASNSNMFSLTTTVTTPEYTHGQPATCTSTTSLEYCDNVGFLQTYACSTTCTNSACDDPVGDICPDPKVLSPADSSLVDEALNNTNSIEFPKKISENYYIGSFDKTNDLENIYSIDLAAGDLFSLSITSVKTTINTFMLKNYYNLNSYQKNFLNKNPNSLKFYTPTTKTYFIIINTSNTTNTNPYNLT